MRKTIIFIVALLVFKFSFAQDTTKIVYTQEKDTLAKQHFIDRHELFFMTKVPVNYIIKVDYISSLLRGSGFNLAYEYKLLPAVSLEGGLYYQIDRSQKGITLNKILNKQELVDLWLNGKVRWYPNMNKRIEKGLNANNFSGAYLALSLEQSLIFNNKWPRSGKSSRRAGLEYGFQSRLSNDGHVDFSVGLFHQQGYDYQDLLEIYDSQRLKLQRFKIATQANFGLGIVSFKRRSSPLTCETLICDEEIKDQWKVTFPDISISTKAQWMNAGITYERKLAKSPVSLSAELNSTVYNTELIGDWNTRASAGFGLQARYYYLQKWQIRTGNGGNNFSGPYAGLRSNYSYGFSRYYLNETAITSSTNSFSAGLTTGFQRRLLKKVFADLNLTYWKSMSAQIKRPGNLILDVGFGFTF